MYRKQLGIFVRVPEPGRVKTRLSPSLTPAQACRLYEAFLCDLFRRLKKLPKEQTTVFFSGDGPDALDPFIPDRAIRREQRGADLGERLVTAFDELLAEPRGPAVIIGSDSPDIPLRYIRLAYRKLKHKDVVLGPAADGGYYLVGLRAPVPQLFEKIAWGTGGVLGQTLEVIARENLSVFTLPLWYDVDSAEGLRTLKTSLQARRLERRDRLFATERVLDDIY